MSQFSLELFPNDDLQSLRVERGLRETTCFTHLNRLPQWRPQIQAQYEALSGPARLIVRAVRSHSAL